MKPSHLCRWLDNKEFALPPLVDAAKPPGPEAEPGTPYSCGKTHQGFGPDGELACADDCVSGRGCFQRDPDPATTPGT